MKRLLSAPRVSPSLRHRVRPGLAILVLTAGAVLSAQDRQGFLEAWNRQADFFQSNEARFGNFRITPEYEQTIGAAATVTCAPAPDAEAQRFVQAMASRIAQASPAAVGAVTVALCQDERVQAVTVPGRMFMSSGVLAAVASESELAAVVSHELGHLYAHHASRRLIKAARGQAMVNFLTASLAARKVSPNAQGLATLAGSIGLDLYLKAYDRGEELEADRYAAHLLFNAGFSPSALTSVLGRMSQQSGITLFSTHPPLGDRLRDVGKYVADFPARPSPRDSTAFTRAVKKQTPVIRADTPPPASALPPVVAPPASALPPVKRPPHSSSLR